jgi:hypothetical protein
MTKASISRAARRLERKRLENLTPEQARRELAEWAARGGIKIEPKDVARQLVTWGKNARPE